MLVFVQLHTMLLSLIPAYTHSLFPLLMISPSMPRVEHIQTAVKNDKIRGNPLPYGG